MALRDPWLLQQLGLFQSLGPQVSSPDVLRRAIFSPSLPREQALRYFARMQSESVRVALELMWPQMPAIDQPLHTPLLVLGAEHDAFVSPVMVRATAAAYGTTAEIIPKTAHAMMLEMEWRRAADKILAWLQLMESAQTAGPAKPDRQLSVPAREMEMKNGSSGGEIRRDARDKRNDDRAGR
jgi:hypothetical protein